MKMLTTILYILILLSIATQLRADLGSCVLYHAKFYMKDGSTFNGCFRAAGYGWEADLDDNETNKFCDDEGVFEAFKLVQRDRKSLVQVYETLHIFQPTPIFGQKDDFYMTPSYGVANREDIRSVDSSDIHHMVYWEIERCKNDWLTSEVALCDRNVIDTLLNGKYWNAIYVELNSSVDTLGFNKYSGAMWGFHLINYSSKNNLAELKRLAQLKLSYLLEEDYTYSAFKKRMNIPQDTELSVKMKKLYRKQQQEKIERVKEWMWKRGIFMIRVNGTC